MKDNVDFGATLDVRLEAGLAQLDKLASAFITSLASIVGDFTTSIGIIPSVS